jgi:hypothetical protein
MKLVRRADDHSRGVLVGEHGDVLGYARDIRHEDGGLAFENDFAADASQVLLADTGDGTELIALPISLGDA